MLFFITLSIAAVGSYIGVKLKIPVGGLLGAMIFTTVFNIIYEPVFYMPPWFNLLFQIPLGVMIGGRVSREDVISMRKLWKSAFVIIFTMLVLNIGVAVLIKYITHLNIETSIFATAPGGMVDMTLISYYFGGNMAYVSIIQIFRNTMVLVTIAPLYRKILNKFDKPKEIYLERIPPEPGAKLIERSFLKTLFCASLIGILFRHLGIPAGALIGGMLGAILYNVFTNKGYFPTVVRSPMRVMSGFFIGMNITRTSIATMGGLPFVLIIVLIYVWVVTFVCAYLVHKLTGLDFSTSLLSSTPGGISEMAIIADEMDINSPTVAILHTARLMSVVIFFPIILPLVISTYVS